MSDQEMKVLIRLVQWLAAGKVIIDDNGEKWHESGLSYQDIIKFVNKPIQQKSGMTALECIKYEGDEFVNQLIEYVQEQERR